ACPRFCSSRRLVPPAPASVLCSCCASPQPRSAKRDNGVGRRYTTQHTEVPRAAVSGVPNRHGIVGIVGGGIFVSIVRVGLAETKNFAEGYEAIFGAKKPAAKPAPKTGAAKKKKKPAKKKK